MRECLVATAAGLVDERGSAGLSWRGIAREARVTWTAFFATISRTKRTYSRTRCSSTWAPS